MEKLRAGMVKILRAQLNQYKINLKIQKKQQNVGERIDQEKEVLEVKSASSKYNIKIKQIQPYEKKFKIKGATKQESKT